MVKDTMRIGVDVGGTFTDVVLEANGELFSTKVLTTYHAPEEGVLTGVRSLVSDAEADLSDLDTFIYGTTLATNALLERNGAHTALVTTDGFRDTIEMRTESRFEQYDLNLELPTPLIERRHRHTLTERIAADGTVLRPFDENEARALIECLADRPEGNNYQSVAVGFIHSYVNDDHERRFRELLLERLPEVEISISSEVSAQMREFERFNTVCANAYLQPLMGSHLRNLELRLHAAGATCPMYLMHSGGGLIDVDTAASFPVRLVESGPAGGAIFASDIATRHNLGSVLSYDMGGTTAKVCIIEDGTPGTAKTFEVARTHRFKKGSGMPISVPVIEMIEIGAGGGSIAEVDALGQIRVGPLSASSEPGPAAYGLGGTQATVTDANLVLGRLSADTFGAPGIDLVDEKARAALAIHVATPLNLNVEAAAIGITEVVDENMSNAARVHAVENGKDLSKFTIIAFGGGAPLHAARLCEKLGANELLVPPGAGVGSAIGLLRAPFAYEALRSHYVSMDSFNHEATNQLLDDLTEEASKFVRSAIGDSNEQNSLLEIERYAFMRYAGQGWEIPVRLDDSPFDHLGGGLLTNRFEKAYEEFFGRAIDGLLMEAIGWSVRVSTSRPAVERIERIGGQRDVAAEYTRKIYDSIGGTAVEAAVVDREVLATGDRVAGPAVIIETQTSTWLTSAFQAVLQADGCLLITKNGSDPI